MGLRGLVLLQERHDRRGGRDGAAFAVLRTTEPEAAARVALVKERLLVDRDGTGLEVHAVPRQAEHFTLAHAGEKRHRQQRFKARAVDLLQKGGNLRIVQRCKLLALHTRQLAGVSGVKS